MKHPINDAFKLQNHLLRWKESTTTDREQPAERQLT